MTNPPDKLLDVSMVARRLGVSTPTVYRMIKNGRFPSVNVGAKKAYRVPESAVNRVLDPET